MLPPPCIYGPVDKWSKSSPFHGEVPGSNPGRVTKEKQIFYLTNVRLVNLKTIYGSVVYREAIADLVSALRPVGCSFTWPGRLVARTPTSQVGERGIETLSGHHRLCGNRQ